MKNLGKTIDRLIQIDNDLKGVLKPIKDKWERFPKREKNYWNELLTFLNSKKLMSHPEREQMRKILNSFNKKKRPIYTFEIVSERDTVIGPITGKLADKIRRLDLRSVKIAKEIVEANMTHNHKKQIELIRKSHILGVDTKRMWIEVKDLFKLWSKPGNYKFKMYRESHVICLVEQFMPPQVTNSGVIKMDPEMLRRFFNYIGMEPPPNLLGGEK